MRTTILLITTLLSFAATVSTQNDYDLKKAVIYLRWTADVMLD